MKIGPPVDGPAEFRDKTGIFRKGGGLQLSENTTFMLKFVGTIKWGAFLGDLAGSFAPEVVFKAGILISKQTALFIPICFTILA